MDKSTLDEVTRAIDSKLRKNALSILFPEHCTYCSVTSGMPASPVCNITVCFPQPSEDTSLSAATPACTYHSCCCA